VSTDRTFSMRTGLAASTVTPGSTAPDTSLTTPVIAPCAKAAAGRSNSDDTSTSDRATTLEGIRFLLGTPLISAPPLPGARGATGFGHTSTDRIPPFRY